MPGNIFISYRRDDTRADARSVDQRLRRRFGADRVFLDVDTIQKGRDFRKGLAEALESSTVMLAMVGPSWLGTPDDNGRRRIDDPNDFVRLEIGSALKRDIAVIPVLVGGARMPLDTALPEDIRGLVYRQAAIVTHENFARDMDGIERDIAELIGDRAGGRSVGRVAAAGLAVLALLGGAWIALPYMGIAVPTPWSPTITSKPVDTPGDPTRLAAERAKAEAESKRLVEAEVRDKVEVKRKADEAATQRAGREAMQRSEEERRRIETEAVTAAQRQGEDLAAKAKAEGTRLLADAAASKRAAEVAQASRRAAAEKLVTDAADARRKAEDEVAMLAPQEDEALRKAQAERRGNVFRLWTFPDLDDQCQVLGMPLVEVVTPPKLGAILLRSEPFVYKFAGSKLREKCIGKSFPGRAVYYVINAQTVARNGTDAVVIRQRSTTGTSLWEFEVNLATRNVKVKSLVRE